MNILVTGAAGFIGFHLIKCLQGREHVIVGLDNINNYYDSNLKYDRLVRLGIERTAAHEFNELTTSITYPNIKFIRAELEDKDTLEKLFQEYKFHTVCNLAAQAGVRYSLEKPETYISSNISGFLNILECCRHYEIKQLIYASSSSVYGLNKELPFRVSDRTDHPASLYAASKKSNELMAHCYSHLFGIPTTGLRFFTVYGPWGRPDMALFLFTEAIIKDSSIEVFNNGEMERDFTYIDDIVNGILKILEKGPKIVSNKIPYNLYNIGNNQPVALMDFIHAIEHKLNKKAQIVFKPLQPGDVERTWADSRQLQNDYNYSPNTPIQEGVGNFIDWYREYYQID